MKTRMTDEQLADQFERGRFEGTWHERSEIAELEAAVQARRDAEERVLLAVRDARQRGIPWTAIAIGLGVSHQAAMQRYRAKI